MGTVLNTFFQENGFRVFENVTYGQFQRRMFTFSNRGYSSYYRGVFSFAPISDPNKASIISLKLNELKTKYKEIQQIICTPVTVDIAYYKSKDVDYAVISSLTDISNILDNNEVSQIDVCPLCQNTLYPDSSIFLMNGVAIQAHDECIRKFEESEKTIIDSRQEKFVKNRSRVKGILGALLGTILGGALLFFLTYMDSLVVIGSFAIYLLSNYFYNKFNGKIDKIRFIIVCTFSVLGVILFYYLGTVYYIYKDLGLSITLLESFKMFFTLLKENSEFMRAVAINYILLLAVQILLNWMNFNRFNKHMTNPSMIKRIK